MDANLSFYHLAIEIANDKRVEGTARFFFHQHPVMDANVSFVIWLLKLLTIKEWRARQD